MLSRAFFPLLAVIALATALLACGEEQDAYAYCSGNGSTVWEETWDVDGNVYCRNYLYYTAPSGGLAAAGFYKKHKKSVKPRPNPALISKVKARSRVVVQQRKAAEKAREAARQRSSGSSSSRSSGSSSRSSGSRSSGKR